MSAPVPPGHGWLARHPVAGYLVVTYLWTWGLALPLLASRRGWIDADLGATWEVVSAFGPAVAAALVTARLQGPAGLRGWLAALLRRPIHAGWARAAWLSPFVVLGLAVVAVRLGSGAWPQAGVLASGRLGSASGVLELLLVAGLLQGLGEEPGWRGFLLPRLRERRGPLGATVLLFPAWLLWHLPAFLGRPEFGPAQFVAFAAGVLAAAAWLTFIVEKTGSVAVAVAWHALINIARGVALALSTAHFLAFSSLVLAGALAIMVSWIAARAGTGRAAAGPGTRD